MTTTILATYDGEVLRPHGPLPVPANTEVRVTVEPAPEAEVPPREPEQGEKPFSSLEVIASLNLPGPPDWSKRLDDYTYSRMDDRDD
jgi:hypothetical protein